MALYFFLHDPARFHTEIVPALTISWKQRSFAPCRPLCAQLLPVAEAFGDQHQIDADGFLLRAVVRGLAFDRTFWRSLAGELLWFAAVDVPEIPTAADTLLALLDKPERTPARREHRTPIQQAHCGSRDVVFGGHYYRPGSSGYNDRLDVVRLAEFLGHVDPAKWSAEALIDLTDPEERAEELEYARQCFAALRGLYQDAAQCGQMVICEQI
jgi:hypothetical protein